MLDACSNYAVTTHLPALLVVDHGSRRAQSNAQLEQVAQDLRRLCPQALVVAAHMELCAPDIASAVAQLAEQGAQTVHVLPYFLADGRHLQQDIPRLVAEACAAHGLTYHIGQALGPDPRLARLLLERCGLSPA